MFAIRHVTENDMPFWLSLDTQICARELVNKVRLQRGYVILDGDTPVGILRYNLMYDIFPFLTLINIGEAHQKKGFGSRALAHWENEMRACGHKMVMTSTRADETAQHFYRKLGYVDKGAIFFDHTPYEQPLEIVMIKVLQKE